MTIPAAEQKTTLTPSRSFPYAWWMVLILAAAASWFFRTPRAIYRPDKDIPETSHNILFVLAAQFHSATKCRLLRYIAKSCLVCVI
jgi:hypothetical protein